MRILVFAYACEPGEGSEPGAGWAFVRMLSRLGEVTVVTRANNEEAIHAGLGSIAEGAALRFVYVDLPRWARWWKRGGRGIHLYSFLWQWAALREVKRLPERWDLVWHATLANVWLGSVAPLAGAPSVVGPVGGGVSVPLRAYGALGFRGILAEVMRSAIRGACRYANPLARSAWRRADLILSQNPETRDWLPRRYRHKVRVFPNVVLEGGSGTARVGGRGPGEPPVAVCAGRLIPWKGVRLLIRALAHAPGWRLQVVGGGRDEMHLRRLAAAEGVAGRVDFKGVLPRSEALEAIARADVFVHPSLREEAGWTVAEAIQAGRPALSLDRGGPPVLGATTVRVGTASAIEASLAAALRDGVPEPAPGIAFDLDARWSALRSILIERGIVRGPAAEQPARRRP